MNETKKLGFLGHPTGDARIYMNEQVEMGLAA